MLSELGVSGRATLNQLLERPEVELLRAFREELGLFCVVVVYAPRGVLGQGAVLAAEPDGDVERLGHRLLWRRGGNQRRALAALLVLGDRLDELGVVLRLRVQRGGRSVFAGAARRGRHGRRHALWRRLRLARRRAGRARERRVRAVVAREADPGDLRIHPTQPVVELLPDEQQQQLDEALVPDEGAGMTLEMGYRR